MNSNDTPLSPTALIQEAAVRNTFDSESAHLLAGWHCIRTPVRTQRNALGVVLETPKLTRAAALVTGKCKLMILEILEVCSASSWERTRDISSQPGIEDVFEDQRGVSEGRRKDPRQTTITLAAESRGRR